MADYSITSSAVKQTAATVSQTYTSSGATAIGKSVYLDSATNTVMLAQADDANTSTVKGITLSESTAADQPIVVAIGGDVTMDGLNKGDVVILSAAAAGGLAPDADATIGNIKSIIGYATTDTNLKVNLINTGVVI